MDYQSLLIAVADGAGSASHSEIGAAIICHELAMRIPDAPLTYLFDRDYMISLLTDIRQTVSQKAEALNIPVRELAATVLLAIVAPHAASFAQLGDGAIVVDESTETYRTIFWPDEGEYVNSTHFLTDRSFAQSVRFETISQPLHRIAVFTDGIQRLALDFTTGTPHPGFFRPLFSELQGPVSYQTLNQAFHAFLASEALNARTDDDKTLVVAIREP